MEKPKDEQEHREFLRHHSQNKLQLITSMTLATCDSKNNLKLIEVQDEAVVHWDLIEEEFIDFVIKFDERLKYCSGGFTVEGLLKSKI